MGVLLLRSMDAFETLGRRICVYLGLQALVSVAKRSEVSSCGMVITTRRCAHSFFFSIQTKNKSVQRLGLIILWKGGRSQVGAY